MKYFTIKELTRTGVNLPNLPNASEEANLLFLVETLLDMVREEMGMPITVNSGFRTQAVNKAVGGAANSQHTKGEAADITCTDNKRLFELIKKSYRFDQLIWEFGNDNAPAWVHVSKRRDLNNRGEILRARKDGKGKTYYEKMK